MGMTIETIIKDCEQSIKQSELFIKAHQKNMEIGEIKEYQYYIERDKLIIETMRKYQTVQAVLEKVWDVPACMLDKAECLDKIMETYKTVR